jgi:hypothetical protein
VLSFEESAGLQNPFTFAYESDYESEEIDTETESMPRRKLSADAKEWIPSSYQSQPQPQPTSVVPKSNLSESNIHEIGRFLLFVALSS